MKTRSITQNIRQRVLTAVGLGLITSLTSLPAADKTWDGGGDQSSWSGSPANWDLDTDPVANDRLFFGGNIGLFPNNNFPADTDFAGIIFNAGADPFSISGNEIDLAANSGITNNSANAQTISANIDNNGANKVHNALAGDLIYLGVLRNNSIIKEGPFAMTTGGPTGNSAPGLTLNEGTVIAAKSAGNAFAGNFVINTNGTFRLESAGAHTDQIHFNTRVNMNGGRFQMQHVDSVNTTRLEEVASLSGSNLASIVECGLANSTNTFRIGGGSNHRAIYSGTIRDGAAGVLNLEVYRGNNFQQLDGTNTYSGVTLVNNVQAAGAARLIVNGQHTGGGDYTVNGHSSDTTRFGYLNGSGIISANVLNFNIRGILSPGGSLSADLTDAATFADSTAILTVNSPVNLNDATSTLEIQANGTTPGTGHDQLVIGGSGTFSNNNANLRFTLGYTPATGDKITIVTVPGTDSANNVGVFASLNGVLTDLSQGATFVEPSSGKSFRISYRAEGTTFDAGVGNGNNIMLEVIADLGNNLTWRGDVNYLWDIITTANWRDTGGTALTFTNGDNVTFNDSGSNAAPIDLTTDLNPGNILVNATKDYVLATSTAGKLTGTIVLTKTNTGTLTILTDNENAGSTLVRQGTVRIGTNGTSGLLSGALDISSGASVIFNRSDIFTNSSSITGSGSIINNSTNGTLILTGDSPFTGGVAANAGTLQFGDGTGVSGSIAGRVTNNATVAYSFNNAVVVNNSLSGTGLVNLINTTATSRRFTMGATVNNLAFSGTFNVGPLACLTTPDLSAGTNQLGVGSTVYVEDTGSVLLDRGGTYLSTFYIQGAGNGAGNAGTPVALEIEGISPPTTITGNVNVLSSVTIGGFIGTSRISGRLVDTNGFSTITFANGRGPGTSFNLQLGSVSGPNHWANTIIDPDLSGGVFTVTAMTPNAISTNGLTLGANGRFALNGNNHSVANLQSTAAGGVILNNNASTPAVLSVGADDSSTSFYGVFSNGSTATMGLTKVGTGILTCDGDSTSTGPVTVQGGTLALAQVFGSGSFSNASVISIASGATLDVSTRADGTLTLNSGQTLKHSGSSTGPITVTGSVNLGNGTLLLGVNRTGLAHDSLAASGSVTYRGTLAVTNTGAALQPGDKFQLFPSAVSGFTTYALPTVDAVNFVQYTWQNDVATDGSVTVLTVAPLTPPTLGVSQTGNTLNFSWTGPFKLQSQTNSLNVGISSNWFNYPGGSTSPVSVTINPTNATVFFRLSLQ